MVEAMTGAAYDLVVIGLGAVGSWAMDHAARAGLRCVGIEQFELGHARGSSHGHSRVTRAAYFEHPSYVPLIRSSTELIRGLEREVRTRLLVPCGTLLLGAETSEVLRRSQVAAGTHGVEVRALDPTELARQFPMLSPPSNMVGLLEPGGGFIRLEASLAAVRARARHHGAELRGATKARGLEPRGAGVCVRLEHETLEARAALICAGPWASRMVPALRPRLRVTRQVQGWIRAPSDAGLRSDEGMPCWLMDRGSAPPTYGIPTDPDRLQQGSKVAIHGGSDGTDPDEVQRAVSAEERAELAQVARRLFSCQDITLHDANVCMYTNTADEHMILDRPPHLGAVTVVAGLSGHGFKMAPALALAAVRLAAEGHRTPEADFLRLAHRPTFMEA